jgi:hypothetical protein
MGSRGYNGVTRSGVCMRAGELHVGKKKGYPLCAFW